MSLQLKNGGYVRWTSILRNSMFNRQWSWVCKEQQQHCSIEWQTTKKMVEHVEMTQVIEKKSQTAQSTLAFRFGCSNTIWIIRILCQRNWNVNAFENTAFWLLCSCCYCIFYSNKICWGDIGPYLSRKHTLSAVRMAACFP